LTYFWRHPVVLRLKAELGWLPQASSTKFRRGTPWASLSHWRAANKCGAAILPFDSGTALGWKKTIVGREAMPRLAISTFYS
jgi:hypothetical protein